MVAHAGANLAHFPFMAHNALTFEVGGGGPNGP
jgi:hypothetical protein